MVRTRTVFVEVIEGAHETAPISSRLEMQKSKLSFVAVGERLALGVRQATLGISQSVLSIRHAFKE